MAVAEGILGQRVTWEGSTGIGGDSCTCVTVRVGSDGKRGMTRNIQRRGPEWWCEELSEWGNLGRLE